MKKMTMVGLALCLLLGGCASGDAFMHYDDNDNVGNIVGKTLGNVVLATAYVTGFVFYALVLAALDGDDDDCCCDTASTSHVHRMRRSTN